LRPPEAEAEEDTADVASWFFCDPAGLSGARLPRKDTIAKNYAWRSYFHGGPADREPNWRPPKGSHLDRTKPSDVFASQANNQWIVAISTPIYGQESEREFLGVVALTVKVGQLVEEVGKFGEPRGSNDQFNDQFAVLVDWRDGVHRGVILDHPLFKKLLRNSPALPSRFQGLRVQPDDLPATLEQTKRAVSTGTESRSVERSKAYRDPLAKDQKGSPFDRHWLAQMEPVVVRDEPSGWLMIVQESYDRAIGSTLRGLRGALLGYGLVAVATVVFVILGLWVFTLRLLRHTSPARVIGSLIEITERSTGSVTPDAPTETHPNTGPGKGSQ
jgi:hypothetical protein